MPILNDGPAADAVREASALVAQAITRLAALGPDAPSTVREALQSLGTTFSVLGWSDPSVPYSIRSESDR